jgi:hypothetical protein
MLAWDYRGPGDDSPLEPKANDWGWLEWQTGSRGLRKFGMRAPGVGKARDPASGTQIDAAEDPRLAEFQLLASGAPLIGANHPGAHLHAETLDRSVWDS